MNEISLQISANCDHQRIETFLKSDHYRIEDVELIAHLDSCAACREYLESHAADRETWERAKTLLKTDAFDNAATAAFSAAGSQTQSGHFPHAIQDVLDALAPTDDPHRLGRIGTYEIAGVIGAGAMGVVLKAIDPSLDRVIALKVMAPRLANNETARKRFAREAKAAAAVLHPNVIPIHSVSSDKTLPYLVMAFIRGGSLQKRLEKEGPLQLVEILRIGSQIAAGLSAAHEQGLVHRDIKPENILLEEGIERVTITDFGLARAVDDNTVTQMGVIAGTPMYMSPEQARGEQVDQLSDLFSLGSVLYALCTGQPPYRADSSYGVMRRIIDESPMSIRKLNPAIPEWLACIVERLMAKEKADRFATASEVHKLLDACLSHVQQPSVIALPAIPGRSSLPEQRSFLKTRKGLFLMLSTAAAILCATLFMQPEKPSVTEPAPDANQISENEKSDELQIIEQFQAWKKLPADSTEFAAIEKKISELHQRLLKSVKPNTGSARQLSQYLAVELSPFLAESIPQPIALAIANMTKPDTGIRMSDRLAAAGRPTEPLGWDVQAVHALALGRAGQFDNAILENDALWIKIDTNLLVGNLPDLEIKFLGKSRSQKSLQQQLMLQKALLLALAGKTVESVDAATAAGKIKVNKRTIDDDPAIEAIIQMIATASTEPVR